MYTICCGVVCGFRNDLVKLCLGMKMMKFVQGRDLMRNKPQALRKVEGRGRGILNVLSITDKDNVTKKLPSSLRIAANH